MNKLAKKIWGHNCSSGWAGVVFTDEAGRFEKFIMPDEQDALISRLFDISKTHKAMSYGSIPMGLSPIWWCPVLQVCKDKGAGGVGYDIDAELVEAFVVCSGGSIDYSNRKEVDR